MPNGWTGTRLILDSQISSGLADALSFYSNIAAVTFFQAIAVTAVCIALAFFAWKLIKGVFS